MEKMTSENICRIEITENFVPAQVLEKQIKTENISTKTITKLETLVW